MKLNQQKKIEILITSTLIIAILLIVFMPKKVRGMRNPSAVYCQEMGYEFSIKETEEGEIGICTLPDGTSVGAWDFLKGKVAKEYSYCEKEGYTLKTIVDSEKCSSIVSNECAVCVTESGEEIEIAVLMGLDFSEKLVICGDNICDSEFGENYQNCPQDCLAPEEEKIKEEIEKTKSEKHLYFILGGIGILLVIIGGAIYYYRKFYYQKNRKK